MKVNVLFERAKDGYYSCFMEEELPDFGLAGYGDTDVYKRQKLYSLKVYNASETAIPDMILCKPLQQYINANFPGTTTKVCLLYTSRCV